MNEDINKVLDSAKEADYTGVIVLGLKEDSGVNINTSFNNLAVMHWVLNRSIFDLNVFEKEPKQVDQETKEE
jgi:hypothetical protein